MDAIHLPNAITLPTAFGAAAPAVQPGQVIQALVLDLIESDLFRLQLPQAVIDVRASVPLTIGSTITLAVKSGGANARLAIYAGNVPAQSLSTREPLGEAVVVARVTPNAAPAAKTAGEAPLVRDAPSVSPARAPVAQPTVPQPQATPERALGEAVRAAGVRQSGAAPLFADAEKIAQMPSESVPPPVREAAAQLAALRVPLDENLTAADIKQAFVQSGVLLEPKLAAARLAGTLPPAPSSSSSSSPSSSPSSPAASAPARPADVPPAADLKAALLVLRQVVKSWADDTTPQRPASAQTPAATQAVPEHSDAPRAALPLADPVRMRNLASTLFQASAEVPSRETSLLPEQAVSLAKAVAAQLAGRDMPEHGPAPTTTSAGPPPPYRGAPLSGQPPVAAAIDFDTPAHESAERLLTETDGAIARTTLLQAASLPDQAASRTDPAAQRWTFEVPFATAQGTSIAQFEVSRDPRAAQSERQLPTWRARFTLDLEPMGPVHALVGIAGTRASVTLWAERAATAQRLNANAGLLGDALRAAALEPADFQFRTGAPPLVARQATPGRFMDRAS